MSAKDYTIENSDSSMKFCFPFRKYWEIISYLLIGLVIILWVIVSQLSKDSLPFLMIVLFWFSPLLIFYFVEILWLLIGKEVVEVNKKHIIIKHQILGVGLSRKYDSKSIQGVFISQNNRGEPETTSLRGTKFLNFKIGKIAINYGVTFLGEINTVRFGSNLEDWEAKDIVQSIHEGFPRYIYIPPQETG